MSRTLNGLKNFKYSFFFFLITLGLNFYSRKIFLNQLGIDLIGLNTTIYNLINFLNVAELGIGVAISYALYKPLADQDQVAIHEIISIFGRFYRKIGIYITLLSLVILAVLPFIFQDIKLSLYYPYIAFVILGTSTIIGYLFNFKQILLSADQKNYIITRINNYCKIVKVIMQVVFLVYVDAYKYEIWLLLELIFVVISIVLTNYSVRKHYPYLTVSFEKAKEYSTKYPSIISKTKQLFFHKLSGFILTQTSPLLLLYIANLQLVGLYSNYQMIIVGVTALLSTVFSGIVASVGNLINDKKDEVIKIYWEILLVEFILVSSVCFVFYFYANSFISIWLGDQYLLDALSFKLLTLYLFFNLIRQSDIFLSAYGLFGDIWAPIVEMILNLGGAIILGKWLGLPGILLGINFSLFIIVFLWKPFYLFTKGFETTFRLYAQKMFFLLVIASIAAYSIYSIGLLHLQVFQTPYLNLILSTVCNVMGFLIIEMIFYTLFFKEFKRLIDRFKRIVFK